MTKTAKRPTSCPCCSGPMPRTGMAGVSLSRADNHTDICSDCGVREAVQGIERAWNGKPPKRRPGDPRGEG